QVSSGVSIPLNKVGPEEWKETLAFLQTTDHKCQITISSDQITIFGPQQYQRAITKSLQRIKICTNLTDEGRGMSKKYTSPYDEDLIPSIKDQLVIDGLLVDKKHWEIMTNHMSDYFELIKEKFNVSFKEAELTQDKLMIKVRYNRSEESMQMESHAAKALLRLYQKVAASHQVKGAAGKINRPEEKSSKGYTEGGAVKKPSGAGAKKDEKEEENCPVCLDTFTNKTRLKCNHEFCKECLEQSIKSQGPVCPVCKDVFGLVEGIQPPGSMKWHTSIASLPGYEGCGRIDIHYHIPSGTQTAKHPNPGQRYQGLDRQAYLPDNREGNEVLQLLKKAFDQKLIFTVGTSRTTGAENMVTWNDIHHKTSPYGGPQSFGYPDPNYLSRVKEELKANGIK
ncbi:probable E3 ubiquitin-protein ligase DTX2, partial [Eucyclogobius newberryi]|uniref:probable E3 ubiquitin-protein ligase DTX2 n=1 Tax=Eucyclogobius newberryi TaxID=166745 RepID=UPI003B5AD570